MCWLIFSDYRKHLSQYITETVRDGQTYISWSHERTADHVRSRLPTNLCISLHTIMANMYMDHIHSYINNQNKSKAENPDKKQPDIKPERLVRCFDVLPHHIVSSDVNMDAVKERLYCSLDCLVLRLHVSSLSALTEDLQQLRGDEQLRELLSLLVCGQDLLCDDQDLLKVHLADLILSHLCAGSLQSPNLTKLAQQCRSASDASPHLHLSPVLPYITHTVHKHHIKATSILLYAVQGAVYALIQEADSTTTIMNLRTLMPIRRADILTFDREEIKDPPHIVISQDGRHVVTFEEGIVTLQQLQSCAVIRQLDLKDDGNKPSIKYFVTNYDCSTIIMVTTDNKLVTLNPNTSQITELFPVTDTTGSVTQKDSDTQSEAGRKSGSGSPQLERTTSVVSTSKVNLIAESPVADSEVTIKDVQFSPDFKHLAMVVQASDCKLVIWDTQSWQTAVRLHLPADACTKPVFSPDSSMLVVRVFPMNHVLVGIQEGAIVQTLEGDDHDQSMCHQCKPCFGQTGRLVLVQTHNNQAALFHTDSGDKMQAFRNTNSCTALLFSDDESFVFIGDSCGVVSIWDVVSGRQIWTLDCTKPIESLFFDTHRGDSSLYTVTTGGDLDCWGVWGILKACRARRLTACTTETARLHELRQISAKQDQDKGEGYVLDLDMISVTSKETNSDSSKGNHHSVRTEASAIGMALQ